MQFFSADAIVFSKKFKKLFLTPKTWKNCPQKLLIIGPTPFFSILARLPKRPEKQKSRTPKSPLLQDWVFRLGVPSISKSDVIAKPQGWRNRWGWWAIAPPDFSSITCSIKWTYSINVYPLRFSDLPPSLKTNIMSNTTQVKYVKNVCVTS